MRPYRPRSKRTRPRETYRHWLVSGMWTKHECNCEDVQFCDICAPSLRDMREGCYEIAYALPDGLHLAWYPKVRAAQDAARPQGEDCRPGIA